MEIVGYNMDDAAVHNLEEEIRYLRSLLDKNGIKYDFEAFLRARDEKDESSQMVPIDISYYGFIESCSAARYFLFDAKASKCVAFRKSATSCLEYI